MAFYDDKDEENKDGEAPVQTSAPSSVIGSGVSASQSSGAPQSASAATPPKMEPFVGISQYINANKPQSEKLSGQVVGNINQKAGAVDSALNSATNSFNQAAESQSVQPDVGLFDQVESNAEQVAADQAKANRFATLRDTKYTGPQKLEDVDGGNSWAGIQSALSKARQAKADTQTEQGRMGLIKEISNNPRQSQGGLVFDNLLLQSNPNSAAALQNAGSSLNDIDQRLGSAETDAQAKAREISDSDNESRRQAKIALTSGYGHLQSSLASRESDADAKQKKMVEDLQRAITRKSLTPDQLQQLGLDANTPTYGQDLSQFVNYADGADIYSGATQNDIARQNALLDLAGNSVQLGSPILNSANPLGQTGKGFTVDTAGIQKAQDAGRNSYQTALNKPGSADDLRIPGFGVNGKYVPFSKLHQGWKNEAGQPASINEVIQRYERLADTADKGAAEQSRQFLQNVLYPARAQLQSQYHYNDTLSKSGPSIGFKSANNEGLKAVF